MKKSGVMKGKLSIHRIFLIPYVTEESKRENPYTVEMERAAVLCLSEAKRKKIGVLTGGSERISCIAKLYYPFWAVPWDDRCIIVDGLDIISSSIRRNEVPDVLGFTEDLNKSSSSFVLFLDVLKRHSKTFQRFKSSRRITLRGIVNKTMVLKSFMTIFGEAVKPDEEEMSDAVFAPLIISQEQAEERAQRFIEEWDVLNSDVDSLLYAIEVLNRESERHKEKISAEIEEIRGDYDLRISRTKRLVDRRVKSLVKEKEKAQSKIEKAGKRRIEKIIREKNKLKERIERLSLSLREAVKARKRQKSKFPKRSTTRIDNRIAKYRNDIRMLREKMSELEKLEDKIRRETYRSLKEIEEKYRVAISEELGKLEILDESRRLEISEKSKLISRIDQFSSTIESQIRELIAGKSAEMEKLESKAVSFKIDETSLIGIPFYMAVFESPKRVRAEIYPPMVAKSYASALQRIKRMFFSFSLESRMELLFNPRFPELDREVFLNLKRRIRSNISFREMIFEAGKSNNLLESSKFAGSIAEGMSDLEREGWIDRDERLKVMKMYVES